MHKFIIFLFTLIFVHVLQASVVVRTRLQVKEYPWWSELQLEVAGIASKSYDGANITFSLYYYLASPKFLKKLEKQRQEVSHLKHLLCWHNVRIVKNTEQSIPFNISWGPLNGPTQEILAGYYEVVAEISWERQNKVFRKRWQRYFNKHKKLPAVKIRGAKLSPNIRVFRKNYKLFKLQSKRWRKFYMEHILKCNKLYNELLQHKAKALNVDWDIKRRQPNIFRKGQRFSFRKWRIWLDKLIEKLQNTKKILKRQTLLIYPLRYPTTHLNLKDYIDLLLRIARGANMEIYQRHAKKAYDRHIKKKGKTEFGLKNPQVILRTIQILHLKSAAELGVSRKKIYTYLPGYRN